MPPVESAPNPSPFKQIPIMCGLLSPGPRRPTEKTLAISQRSRVQTGRKDPAFRGSNAAHNPLSHCFTILYQQPGIQALQVLNSSKEWIDAPPIEGTLVINFSMCDELARCTNDYFTSTVHRAINCSGVQRYSIPLFFGTDYDVRLQVRGVL
ncbi:hypothetical protein C8F01DRAFT_1032306, partial [Mycena amicta]